MAGHDVGTNGFEVILNESDHSTRGQSMYQNSAFENTPVTHITHENDEIDRLALLPELHRSLNSIQFFRRIVAARERSSPSQNLNPGRTIRSCYGSQ